MYIKLFLIAINIIVIAHPSKSQYYKVVEANKTLVVEDDKGKTIHQFSAFFAKELAGCNTYSISPNGKAICYIAHNKVMIYKLLNSTIHEIMSLEEGNIGVSDIKWNENSGFLAFINANPQKYKLGCKLFVLKIVDNKLVSKLKFDAEALYTASSAKTGYISCDFGFSSPYSIYYTLKNEEQYHDVSLYNRFINFSHIDSSFKYRLVMYGEALPSDYAMKLVDSTGEFVKLPSNVERALISTQIASISPDYKYMIYDDYNKISIYNIITGENTELMSLLQNSEGKSDVIWSPQGRHAAFVNINQVNYPRMTKIFVLELENGKLINKQKFDVPVNFNCGAACYPDIQDFRFLEEFIIQYKRHELIDDNPGAIETVKLQ